MVGFMIITGNIIHALGSYWIKGDTPLKTTLPLLQELANSTPKMQQIWVNSAFAVQGRDDMIERCLDFYDDIKAQMESGQVTGDSIVNPNFTI